MNDFGGGTGGPGGSGPGGQGGGRRRGRRGRRGGRRRRGGKGEPSPRHPGFGGGGGGGGTRPAQHFFGGTNPEDRGQATTTTGDRLLGVAIVHDGPVPPAAAKNGVSPFALFAACMLGITENDGYRTPNMQDISRRFGIPAPSIAGLLEALALDAQSLKECDFDLVGAQMDIQVAPNGMSRTELAKDIYRELLQLPKRATVMEKAAAKAASTPTSPQGGGAAEEGGNQA